MGGSQFEKLSNDHKQKTKEAKMIKFPMKFEAVASALQGIQTQWSAQSDQLPPIPSAIPPEFMGPGGGYSPEDLFGLAILNCLIATFKVYAEKSKATFSEIKGRIIVMVDKNQTDPGFAITQAEVFFDVTGASDVEKVRKLLEAAIRDCAVSNSVKTGKTFHINVS